MTKAETLERRHNRRARHMDRPIALRWRGPAVWYYPEPTGIDFWMHLPPGVVQHVKLTPYRLRKMLAQVESALVRS